MLNNIIEIGWSKVRVIYCRSGSICDGWPFGYPHVNRMIHNCLLWSQGQPSADAMSDEIVHGDRGA